jgi:hypothetical protein
MLRIIFWFARSGGAGGGMVAWLADRPGQLVVNWLGYQHRDLAGRGAPRAGRGAAILWLVCGRCCAACCMCRARSRTMFTSAASGAGANPCRAASWRWRRAIGTRQPAMPIWPSACCPAIRWRAFSKPRRRSCVAITSASSGCFADMLADPEDRGGGAARPLCGARGRPARMGRARGFAERAYRRQPGLDWASDAVIKTHAAQRDWPSVLTVLDSQRRSKLCWTRRQSSASVPWSLPPRRSRPKATMPMPRSILRTRRSSSIPG